MAQLWDAVNRQAAQRVLDRLVKCAIPMKLRAPSQATEGSSHGWGIFNFAVDFNFRLLGAHSRNGLPVATAMTVISRMIDAGRTSLDDFETVHDTWLTEIAKSSPPKMWQFFLPLFIEGKDELSLPLDIELLGTRIVLDRWAATVAPMPADRVGRELATLCNERGKFASRFGVVLSTEDASADGAWRKLGHAFATFRGAFEFAAGAYKQRVMFPFRPMREVAYPPWALVWNGAADSVEGVWFSTDLPERGIDLYKVEAEFLTNLKSFIEKQVGKAPAKAETRSLVANALELYSQALDARHEWLFFLSLWQMAEAITLVREHAGSADKTCARLAQIIRRNEPALDSGDVRDLLVAFSRIRNGIVHAGGDVSVSQDECRLLRGLCEVALNWLIGNQSTLPSLDHLRQFYTMGSQTSAQRLAARDVLQFLKDEQAPS